MTDLRISKAVMYSYDLSMYMKTNTILSPFILFYQCYSVVRWFDNSDYYDICWYMMTQNIKKWHCNQYYLFIYLFTLNIHFLLILWLFHTFIAIIKYRFFDLYIKRINSILRISGTILSSDIIKQMWQIWKLACYIKTTN